ncbi:hypothetical protein [Bradyrhizobium sp. dw_411]|uniref:hypothetical protein n=1 Tax=Bradyrhizobium sp. dw_411 TaxID=2720082 RepID=UPI001BCB5AB3|nr:hypothetical protein [Bradyrhizobium sp. dw_411]
MTKLRTDLSDLPAHSADMIGNDRVIHRKWAYGWLIAYSVLIGATVIFSVATRPERHQPGDRHGANREVNRIATGDPHHRTLSVAP